jgi:beta-barrel assembly-enhancing protease
VPALAVFLIARQTLIDPGEKMRMAVAVVSLFAGTRRIACPLLMVAAALLFAACTTPSTSPKTAASTPAASRGAIALTAPTPEEQALHGLAFMQERLYRVAGPLLTSNAQLCTKRTRNILGFVARNRYSYSSQYANAARTTLELSERLQIFTVLAGSGAARAGVQPGDVLLAIEDQAVPAGENAERQVAAILAPLVARRSGVQITVLRQGVGLVINVPLTYACGFGIELGNTDNVAAYSDGHRVLITRGMLHYARSDDELAYVVAREMAHNILGHPSRRKLDTTLGAIIDNLMRVRPDASAMASMASLKTMPQDMDAAADKLAFYLLARANVNIEPAIGFWQELAARYPASVQNGYTAMHQATAFRIAAMKGALEEIRARRQANKQLLPYRGKVG